MPAPETPIRTAFNRSSPALHKNKTGYPGWDILSDCQKTVIATPVTDVTGVAIRSL